jgi:cell division protein FtsB
VGHAATAARRRSPSRRSAVSAFRAGGAIRWDRVGRIALLVVLGVILLLYVSPLLHWVGRSRVAAEQRTELRSLERDNARLRSRIGQLRDPDVLEREARGLGMVRRGERPYVIEGLRGSR